MKFSNVTRVAIVAMIAACLSTATSNVLAQVRPSESQPNPYAVTTPPARHPDVVTPSLKIEVISLQIEPELRTQWYQRFAREPALDVVARPPAGPPPSTTVDLSPGIDGLNVHTSLSEPIEPRPPLREYRVDEPDIACRVFTMPTRTMRTIADAAQSDERATVVRPPILRVIEGRNAEVRDFTARTFVVDFKRDDAKPGSPPVPVIETAEEGSRHSASVREQNARYLLQFEASFRTLISVKTDSIFFDGEPYSIQIPRTEVMRCDCAIELVRGRALWIDPTFQIRDKEFSDSPTPPSRGLVARLAGMRRTPPPPPPRNLIYLVSVTK